jgi:hypothetical protein
MFRTSVCEGEFAYILTARQLQDSEPCRARAGRVVVWNLSLHLSGLIGGLVAYLYRYSVRLMNLLLTGPHQFKVAYRCVIGRFC